MKKTIYAVAASLMIVSMPAQASGFWSMLKNSTSDGKIDTKQYSIEVSGTNIRGYVFNVPEMKSVCLSIWGGERDVHTLECKTYKEIGLKLEQEN